MIVILEFPYSMSHLLGPPVINTKRLPLQYVSSGHLTIPKPNINKKETTLKRRSPYFFSGKKMNEPITLKPTTKMPQPMDDSSNGDEDYSFEETSTPTTTNNDLKDEQKTKIGEKENKRVIYSRILVMVVLAISVAVTGYFVYSFMSDEEQSSFENDVSCMLSCLQTTMNQH